jgi:hypothetical protein
MSLLAYVVAQHGGATSYLDYDQFEMFPEDLRGDYFNGTLWMKNGKCSEHKNVTN